MTSLFKHNQTLKQASAAQAPRVRVSARVSAGAHDAIIELQRRHRRRTGKALRLWEILDAAVLDYAQANGVRRQP
jgi:hypothetical protein